VMAVEDCSYYGVGRETASHTGGILTAGSGFARSRGRNGCGIACDGLLS
jgi:hypothetical protein